jgi:hypothetical protein
MVIHCEWCDQGESVMRRKSSLYISCMAAGMAAALPMLLANTGHAQGLAQGAAVTGLNLIRAEIPGDNGTEVFTRQADGRWTQFGGRGELRFVFEEVSRTATSVFLFDRSRNFTMEIDISDRTMSFRDAAGNRAVFARVTAIYGAPGSSYSAPPRNMPAPMPSAAPAPAPFVPAATRPAAAPPPSGASDDEFDPFADPGEADAGAGSSADPGAVSAPVTTAQPRTNRDIITGAAATRPAFTQPGGGGAATPARSNKFDGPWVADTEMFKRSGDGLESAITWTFREGLWINAAPDGSIDIHFDANPAGSITLAKVGEGQYAG